MHSQGLAHYCLYPNHVFVRFINGWPKIRIIDLEKVRRDLLKTPHASERPRLLSAPLQILYSRGSPAFCR